MNAPDLVIDKLSLEDVPSVCDLIRQTLGSYAEAEVVLAATFRRLENFWHVYNAPGAAFFVARDLKNEGLVVGGAGLGSFHGLPPSEGVGEVRDMAVAKAYRGCGLGTRLLRRCLDEAKKQNYNRIYLETTADMRTAQKLFVRFGFRPVQQTIGDEGQAGNQAAMPCYYLIENLSQRDRDSARPSGPASPQ